MAVVIGPIVIVQDVVQIWAHVAVVIDQIIQLQSGVRSLQRATASQL
jgi:hypothetical protein